MSFLKPSGKKPNVILIGTIVLVVVILFVILGLKLAKIFLWIAVAIALIAGGMFFISTFKKDHVTTEEEFHKI